MVVAIVMLASWSACQLDEIEFEERRMTGYVGFTYGVEQGLVKIYLLDLLTGELTQTEPVATAVTDENGEYEVDMTGISGTLLVTVGGGHTREFWTSEKVELFSFIHSTAIVPFWPLDEPHVTVTPWTTLADAMSHYRYEKEPGKRYFINLVREMNGAIYEHVIGDGIRFDLENSHCRYRLTCARPVQVDALEEALSEYSVGAPEILYTTSLLSLSALSLARCHDYYDYLAENCDTKFVVDDLLQDIDDDGFLDGNMSANTTVDTLRSEIVEGSLREFWATSNNLTPLTPGVLSRYFLRLQRNEDQRIFGIIRDPVP